MNRVVLHVVNDLDTGGAQTLLEALAGQRTEGQRLALCVLQGPGQLSARMEPLFDSTHYVGLSRRSWSVPALRKGVQAVIDQVRPDVVQSHLLQADLAVLLCRLHGARAVSTVHTTGMTAADPLRSRVLGQLVGRAARRFDAVVACNDSCLAYTRQMGYPAPSVRVISNGVVLPDVVPAPAADEVLLSLARWHPMKDHATLFAALRLLLDERPGVVLRCAGSGMTAENPDLVQLVAEHGVSGSVELLGARDDVPALLAGARALVLSSAYGEALPMAGLEALAHGRPVVTTAVGGCPSLAVRDDLVVPPREPALLAGALASLLDEPDPAALGARARALAERDFDVRSTVAAYDALYDDLHGAGTADAADGAAAVVCLTPRGGHLEHAYDLAASLGPGTTLLSSAGAADYLPSGDQPVRVLELQHRPYGQTLSQKVLRSLAIAAEVRRALDAVPQLRLLVLEEPQTLPAALLRPRTQVVGIVHNAREHDAGTGAAASLRQALKLALVAVSDRIVVHGAEQRELLPARWRHKVHVVELPGRGAFEVAQPHADVVPGEDLLCLGEVRSNKNYEEAVRAAALAGCRLVIAGAVYDEDYADRLRDLVEETGADVVWRPEFLPADAFEELLAGARAVLLPYRTFAAQSGVLERALAAGTPVLCADLPALVEQAAGRPGVGFYPAGQPDALARLLSTPLARPARSSSGVDPRWDALAAAVRGPEFPSPRPRLDLKESDR